MLHAKCKLTALGIEYNYFIVIAQNNGLKKKIISSEFVGIQTQSPALIVTTWKQQSFRWGSHLLLQEIYNHQRNHETVS